MSLSKYPYPYEMLSIAAKVPRMAFKAVTTWDALDQSFIPKEHLERETLLKAADRIAHKFTGEVLKNGRLRTYDDPEGKVVVLDAVALDYEALLEVMYQAYCAGQSSVRSFSA